MESASGGGRRCGLAAGRRVNHSIMPGMRAHDKGVGKNSLGLRRRAYLLQQVGFAPSSQRQESPLRARPPHPPQVLIRRRIDRHEAREQRPLEPKPALRVVRPVRAAPGGWRRARLPASHCPATTGWIVDGPRLSMTRSSRANAGSSRSARARTWQSMALASTSPAAHETDRVVVVADLTHPPEEAARPARLHEPVARDAVPRLRQAFVEAPRHATQVVERV